MANVWTLIFYCELFTYKIQTYSLTRTKYLTKKYHKQTVHWVQLALFHFDSKNIHILLICTIDILLATVAYLQKHLMLFVI